MKVSRGGSKISQISEIRERMRMYHTIGSVAKVEANIADARRDKLTPLPKLSKDKDTVSKIKSLRSKYESINKSGKAIVTTCVAKIKSLQHSIDNITKAAAKSADKKVKPSKKRK